MEKEMLINVSEGEECRIALLDNGKLEELYMERTSSTSHVGNIYKGRVTNVEPSIQAAFVDFGLGRNGFLHISDLMPTYFGRMGDDIRETVGKKMARRDRPPIQRCLRRGDEIIVQIIKEGIGTKGPTLSSYLSIPGRYLVMMPGVGKMGVSQKIEETVPLFHKYGVEREIELMYSRHVPLPSGGSLVIDSTEAIVAIDVNSGKFREHNDAEMTAFKTDMEAAEEIPRQLKLRDLGGVIICDFIDLRYERHRRELEEKLHDKFKNDRARTKVLRMSQFGIIEMTRQRMRPSLKRSIYSDCPHCKGAGLVKTPESMSLDVMRRLAIAAHDQRVARGELAVHPEVAFYFQNRKRAQLARLEEETNKHILIRHEQ